MKKQQVHKKTLGSRRFLIYQIRNTTAAFLVPLRATCSESVFSYAPAAFS